MNDITKIYGFLFIHNAETIQKFYPLINKDWNVLKIHKDWHFAIGELLKDNKPIDIVTIVQCLRENGRLSKDSVLRTSQATQDVEYIRIESLFDRINHDHKILQINKFYRDFTDAINDVNFSPDHVIQLCDNTKNTLLDQGIITDESNDEIIENVLIRHEQAKNGIEIGLQLGWQGTHNKIMLENIDVMVVGGRPAMGKTAWLVSCAKRLAFDNNKKCCVFSLEMSNAQIMRRMIATITGIDSNKIKLGLCNDYELNQINEIKNSAGWQNITFIDGSKTVQDIARKVTELKNANGLDVYLVDYLQKIIPAKTENRYTEVTRISNDIKRLTMGVKIPCIAMAQLSRDSAKQGKRPSLPDLKESGEIEQDASIVAFLHRAEYYGEMTDENGNSTVGKGEFLIAKNREGETGIVPMEIELATSTWDDDLTPTFNSLPESTINNDSLSMYHDKTPF